LFFLRLYKEQTYSSKMSDTMHPKMHQLMMKEILNICKESIKHRPLFGLPDQGSKGDYGYVNPWVLLKFLSQHITKSPPPRTADSWRVYDVTSGQVSMGETQSRFFCGPYALAGKMEPGMCVPFSELHTLNVFLVSHMRQWVINVNRKCRELHESGEQPYLPWSIIQTYLCDCFNEFNEIISSGNLPNDVEEYETFQGREYNVSSIYSRKRAERITEKFRVKYCSLTPVEITYVSDETSVVVSERPSTKEELIVTH